MNEQELTDKAEAFVRDQGNTHSGLADRPRIICWMSSFAKAYADAQVDAAVGRAMNEVGRISVEYNTQIAAKDTEIKRLREFAQQCQQHPQKMVKMNWFEDGSFDYCDLVPLQEAAARVLSPAPVTPSDKCECVYSFQGDLVKQCRPCKESRFIPAPVTEEKFSVSAYPKECSPTIEQLTETDDLTMMQRLGKRMPPFHGVAPVTEAKNEDQV